MQRGIDSASTRGMNFTHGIDAWLEPKSKIAV
jgi:hypothetical protein